VERENPIKQGEAGGLSTPGSQRRVEH